MKKLLAALLVVAALLTASSAYAGAKYLYVVYIGSNYAYGSLGSTRGSPYQDYIGCRSLATVSGGQTYASGLCFAYDRNGVYASCLTRVNDQASLAVIESLGGDGYLQFNWDASGNCTQVYAMATSYVDPKVP